jgi:hypothetical protein
MRLRPCLCQQARRRLPVTIPGFLKSAWAPRHGCVRRSGDSALVPGTLLAD